MHEILFRAKAINRDKGYHKTKYKNGDWVYGLLIRSYDERFENLPAEMTNTSGVSGIEVDYKTIAQYTGLTDKNETKIFEGDIIENITNHNTAVVRWYEEHAAFMLHSKLKHKVHFLYDNDFKSINVIGNIYDNPELLEV